MLLNLQDVFVELLKVRIIMISIGIEDDGEVSLKTTNGITETEIAATIVVEAMRNLFPQEKDVESKLVLVSYDPTSKTAVIDEISGNLDLGLGEARDLVKACDGNKMVVLSSGLKSKMKDLSKRFNPTIMQVEIVNYDKKWL